MSGFTKEQARALFLDQRGARDDLAKYGEEAAVKAILKVSGVLEEGRRAIGDHFAPNDCYATGPMTGDAYRDLVQCPACSFIAMYDELIASVPA